MALLQKRPIILRRLLIVATLYPFSQVARFLFPRGMILDGSKTLIVTDAGNHCKCFCGFFCLCYLCLFFVCVCVCVWHIWVSVCGTYEWGCVAHMNEGAWHIWMRVCGTYNWVVVPLLLLRMMETTVSVCGTYDWVCGTYEWDCVAHLNELQ